MKRQQIEKQTAIVERQGIHIVSAVEGDYLLSDLETEEQYRNDLQRYVFNFFAFVFHQPTDYKRCNYKNDKCGNYRIKMSPRPESQSKSPA